MKIQISGHAGEGKTTVAILIANMLVEHGVEAVVVDDMKKTALCECVTRVREEKVVRSILVGKAITIESVYPIQHRSETRLKFSSPMSPVRRATKKRKKA